MRITYEQLQTIIPTLKTDKELKKTLKHVFSYPENIDTFAYYFYPHATTSKTPKFHYEIYNFLFNKGNGAMAAPRGHAKTTTVGLFFLSWCIANKYKKYIVYMSQNHDKTVQFIEPISTEFKTNTRLKFVYGDLTPKKLKDEISNKDREDLIDIGGVRVQAVSFNKNIRGFKYGVQRPDLIIGDDIDDDERVINPELRHRDHLKLKKQVIPSLSKGGEFKMIGTIIHFDSILMERIKHYKGKIYKACELSEEGKIIPETILWKDYWSLERLEKERKDIGSISFSSEYLNNPIENEACLIHMDWIRKCFDTSMSYDDKVEGVKYLGVDFAFGDRITSDESAFASVVIREDGKKVINSLLYRKGMSITEQFDFIQTLHKKAVFDCVVLEENSIRSMSKEVYTYDFPYYLIWTGNSDTAAKISADKEFENKRHTVSKTNMIKRLGVEFENNNIVLPYKTEEDKEVTNKLVSELLTFALNDGKLVEIGIHADGPIALSMVLEKHNYNNFLLDW